MSQFVCTSDHIFRKSLILNPHSGHAFGHVGEFSDPEDDYLLIAGHLCIYLRKPSKQLPTPTH